LIHLLQAPNALIGEEIGQGFYQKDGFNKKINVKIRASEANFEFNILRDCFKSWLVQPSNQVASP